MPVVLCLVLLSLHSVQSHTREDDISRHTLNQFEDDISRLRVEITDAEIGDFINQKITLESRAEENNSKIYFYNTNNIGNFK